VCCQRSTMGSDEASASTHSSFGALGPDEASASAGSRDGTLGPDEASASAGSRDGTLGPDEVAASARSSSGALGPDEASASAGSVKTLAAFRLDLRSSVYQNGPAFKRQAFLRSLKLVKLVNCPRALALEVSPSLCGSW